MVPFTKFHNNNTSGPQSKQIKHKIRENAQIYEAKKMCDGENFNFHSECSEFIRKR